MYLGVEFGVWSLLCVGGDARLYDITLGHIDSIKHPLYARPLLTSTLLLT